MHKESIRFYYFLFSGKKYCNLPDGKLCRTKNGFGNTKIESANFW